MNFIYVVKIKFFYSININELSLGSILSCHACSLEALVSGYIQIVDDFCRTTSKNVLGVFRKAEVSVSFLINNKEILRSGPADSVEIPNTLSTYDLTTIIPSITCNVRKGVSESQSGSIKPCNIVKPQLYFVPNRKYFLVNDKILCNTPENGCYNYLKFFFEIWKTDKLFDIVWDTQTLVLGYNYSGNSVVIVCNTYYSGNKTGNSIKITTHVESSPYSIIFINNKTVYTVGEFIVCQSIGFPEPFYEWHFNKKAKFNINNKFLYISESSPSGSYTINCTAINKYGLISIDLHILVFSKKVVKVSSSDNFLVFMLIVGIGYFIVLNIIISVIFSESVYHVESKSEIRAPKKVLDQTRRSESLRSNFAPQDSSNVSNKFNLKSFTKFITEICPKNVKLEYLKSLSEKDIIVKVSTNLSCEISNSVIDNFTGNILNRSDDEEIYLNKESYRENVIKEILTLTEINRNLYKTASKTK